MKYCIFSIAAFATTIALALGDDFDFGNGDTFGGGLSSGSSSTLGGSTFGSGGYSFSNVSDDRKSSFGSSTISGSTVFENSSDTWSVSTTTRETTRQPDATESYWYNSQPHNTDTFGNNTHIPYRGSNENNPIGGGYSGDPFKPHGNFLR